MANKTKQEQFREDERVPDKIVRETLLEGIRRGRIDLDDVAAALQLSAEMPGWEEYPESLERCRHISQCRECQLKMVLSCAVHLDVYSIDVKNGPTRKTHNDNTGETWSAEDVTHGPAAPGVH